jgi:hypothetical protein
VHIAYQLKPAFRRVLIATAVLIGVPVQLMLIVFFCTLLPDEIGAAIAVLSPFGLGVLDYFICKSLTQKWGIQTEAEYWLAHRARRLSQQRTRIYRCKQIGVWIPSVVAAVSFLFAPELFGIATHVLYGRRCILNGYEVSRPITWMVFDSVSPRDEELQSAAAFGFKGPLRSGFRGFIGLYSRASAMSFSSRPDPETRFLQRRAITSSRTAGRG